jgi:oligopeptide transport system permease protein
MAPFIFRRLLWSIPVLLSVSLITFILMHTVPGGPWDMLSSKPLPADIKAAIAKKYGLDQPLVVQYLDYAAGALRGDLGPAYSDTRSVRQIIASDFPLSAAFGGAALIIGIVTGVAMGTLSALSRNRLLDRIGMFIVTIGIAVPGFVQAILLILLFGLTLHLVPTQFQRNHWQSWILPVVLLSLRVFALATRFTRGAALDSLSEDYIRTAHMKGLPQGLVLRRHVLRNALLPMATMIGPLAADLLTGSFIVESIFGIPGLGSAFVTSISSRDYPLLMGTTLFFSVLLILFNLLVDLSYSVIDPRIARP